LFVERSGLFASPEQAAAGKRLLDAVEIAVSYRLISAPCGVSASMTLLNLKAHLAFLWRLCAEASERLERGSNQEGRALQNVRDAIGGVMTLLGISRRAA
jgi:hypothetical protein